MGVAGQRDVDLAIVGGGIAGGALATVMARAGRSVLVLERQPAYRDHVRGEILWPWGVAEARRLDLERVLIASGALVVPRFVFFDEGADPAPEDLGESVPPIPGSLNLGHPRACAALTEAATAAGADVRRGVSDVRVTPGRAPMVRWSTSRGDEQVRCRLVVGADGRRSTVRNQARIPLVVDPPAHCAAGLFVDGLDGIDEQTDVIAREADLMFFAFPQGEGRARLYLCFPIEQRSRLAGRDAATRFLANCQLSCLPEGPRWATARIAGPCATFACSDSRTERPFVEGVVLVGDAGGYENPLEGQGLSFAMRDVRQLSDLLLESEHWTVDVLEPYGAERAVRHRLANLGTDLEVWVNEGFRVQDPAERAARFARTQRDEVLKVLSESSFAGLDSLPQDLTADQMWARVDAV
jgi:2-polyprenyl-6-methoxyphenol hydroxylase-like FAD-dependent oxidoreductase